MHPTSASVGNGTFSYAASYDSDLRLSSVSENLISPSLTLFSSTRTYDAVGNVATVSTTLAAGTDSQQFCYDEQNRLTWAGSTGTPPCTGTAITPGSLSSAAYTLGYSYDAMNRIQSNTLFGGYLYGTGLPSSSPVHAATGAGSNGQGEPYYSASYDAVGDMICRAPSSATTCVGTPTGQQLQYDAERRVSHWQSAPGGSPSTSADYLYDGSGNRVEQVDTSAGSTSKVYYLFGGVEEVSSTGSSSTLTKYYSAGGLLIGENVGGTISYLASDGLGSVSEALSTSGTATAAQLYGPYGGVRYSSGTMPTAKGFTGQRADAVSGLDYYGARYYDPVLGQFASADTKQGPNRFAYVADDPETLTDPTGQLRTCMDPPCGGGGGGGGSGGGGGGSGGGGGGSGGSGGSGGGDNGGGGNGTCNASCFARYHHHHDGGVENFLADSSFMDHQNTDPCSNGPTSPGCTPGQRALDDANAKLGNLGKEFWAIFGVNLLNIAATTVDQLKALFARFASIAINKVLSGALAGAVVATGLEALMIYVETQESISWWNDMNNITGFFTAATFGMGVFVAGVTAGALSASPEDPQAAAFAISLAVFGSGAVGDLNGLENQEVAEFNGPLGPPNINIADPPNEPIFV